MIKADIVCFFFRCDI